VHRHENAGTPAVSTARALRGAADGGQPRRLAGLADGFAALTSWMNGLGTFWVFCLMFLICADIIARGAFNAPIRGVAEIVGYSIVAAVFLQIAHTLHVGRFTRAEIVIDWLERKRPAAAQSYMALFHLCGAAVFALITYGTFPGLVSAWQDNEIVGVPGDFTFVIWPFRLIIVAGAAATSIEFILLLARGLRRLRLSASAAPTGWPAIIGLVAIIAVTWLVAISGLSNLQIGLLSIVLMLVLIYAGMHIGVALIVLGFLGIWLIKDNPAIGMNALSLAASEYLANYFFGVIPLFVLMGLLVSVSGVGKETFEVARWLLRGVKGGLGVATVAANAVFAAITGSSIASAAVFTKIASPEMMRHGYTPRFAVGVVAGSSVLGMLIPPSLLLIIYGFLAEQSVGILFIAAIIPGLILATAMGLGIMAMAHFLPHYVGTLTTDDGEAGESIGSSALKLAPILALIVLVLGGIYGGLFTPTEAGAAGAAGALVIALVKRRLSWPKLWQVLVETGHISVSILFLILAANIYARMLAMSGLPQQMSNFIASADLGFYGFMALYVALLVLLGMILDSVSIMLIILPLALPVAQALGGDPIWFGIVTVIAVEIGLLTPPLGITCYVVKSTLADDRITLNDIFAGAFPFVLIMLAVTALLVAVPEISLILV
jgi:C4-dicarboxylate transporter, DctM subunit